MSYAERHRLAITTDTTSTVTDYSPVLTGRVHQILYYRSGTEPSTTMDVTVTVEATSQSVWAQSNLTVSTAVAPRMPTHGLTGTSTAINDYVVLAKDRLKFVLAETGATAGTATFDIVIS